MKAKKNNRTAKQRKTGKHFPVFLFWSRTVFYGGSFKLPMAKKITAGKKKNTHYR